MTAFLLALAVVSACAERAVEDEDPLRAALERGEYAEVLEELDASLPGAPGPERDALLELRALALAASGDVGAALDALADLEGAEPGATAYASLASELFTLGEWEDARRILDAGLAAFPAEAPRFERMSAAASAAQDRLAAMEPEWEQPGWTHGPLVGTGFGYVGGGKPCSMFLVFEDGHSITLE